MMGNYHVRFGNEFVIRKVAFLVSLKRHIALKISKYADGTVIDLDMSACHANVAASIQTKRETLLKEAVKNPAFWDFQVEQILPIINFSQTLLDPKELRKILKVGFYTCLNGGNPTSDKRLLANMSVSAKGFISKFISVDACLKSSDFKEIKKVLSSFELFNQVKNLNESCHCNKTSVYTIDRKLPYLIDSSYKGISRVVQGFEVVQLSILVKEILLLKGLPLSLDHDGVLAFFKEPCNPISIAQILTNRLSDWSFFLLKDEKALIIEPKTIFEKGVELIKD